MSIEYDYNQRCRDRNMRFGCSDCADAYYDSEVAEIPRCPHKKCKYIGEYDGFVSYSDFALQGKWKNSEEHRGRHRRKKKEG